VEQGDAIALDPGAGKGLLGGRGQVVRLAGAGIAGGDQVRRAGGCRRLGGDDDVDAGARVPLVAGGVADAGLHRVGTVGQGAGGDAPGAVGGGRGGADALVVGQGTVVVAVDIEGYRGVGLGLARKGGRVI